MDYHNIFIASFYFFACTGLLTKVILNFFNIQHIASKSDHVPSIFSDKITAKDHLKAATYSIEKLKLENITLVIQFSMLLVWIPFGGLKFIDSLVRSLEFSSLVSGLVFWGVFYIIGLIIQLPESLYRTFVLEQKYGFNKTTFKIFLLDFGKSFILTLVIGGPVLALLMIIMNKLGHLWWTYAWVVIIFLQFFIIWAYPKFIAPLFNRFSKIQDSELIEKINNLIEKCDLQFADYYVMNASLRSSHGNAYFTGFGKNKRIVFFDTLLETLNHDEVLAVLAHELGHLKFKHILKSLLSGICFLGLGFFILGQLYDQDFFFTSLAQVKPSSYMALILFGFLTPVYTFFMTPLFSWLSRKKEYEADLFAYKYSRGSHLISALVKMYRDNASTLTPSPLYAKFYYSHPPAIERIKFIEKLELSKCKSKYK